MRVFCVSEQKSQSFSPLFSLYSSYSSKLVHILSLCVHVVVFQLGGEVGETNAMEKKVRRILTAGSVLVIPITISFPTVS